MSLFENWFRIDNCVLKMGLAFLSFPQERVTCHTPAPIPSREQFLERSSNPNLDFGTKLSIGETLKADPHYQIWTAQTVRSISI